MIDITGISVRELFIHRVGNLLRNEGVVHSADAQVVPARDESTLLQFLFGHADRLNSYAFTHSVDSKLNAISALAATVSMARESLQQASIQITNHLYSVSNHPRVKAGNLFVGIFDGIRFQGNPRTALGVFKSDALNDFVKVNLKDGRASLRIEQGAAISSLDKMALIMLSPKSGPEQVLSACARGEDAVFWNERFLQLVLSNSAKTDTKACLEACRAFAFEDGKRSDDPERILFLNRSLRFFEKEERYNDGAFSSVFTSEDQEAEFRRFKAERSASGSPSIPADFAIERAVVKRERTKFERNLKLDSNIEIRLRFENQEEMTERVERGFDKKRGLAFYKLYYSVEE